jgi:hypothetical protein
MLTVYHSGGQPAKPDSAAMTNVVSLFVIAAATFMGVGLL